MQGAHSFQDKVDPGQLSSAVVARGQIAVSLYKLSPVDTGYTHKKGKLKIVLSGGWSILFLLLPLQEIIVGN